MFKTWNKNDIIIKNLFAEKLASLFGIYLCRMRIASGYKDHSVLGQNESIQNTKLNE